MICWRSVSRDRRNRMRRLARASRNTGGAMKLLRVDTVWIHVFSGSGGTKGLSGPRRSPIGPGANAAPTVAADTPTMPATTTHRQRGLSRWPVGKTRGRKTTRIPIAGLNPAEATHAAGTSIGQSPPAANTDRSYSPPAKVTPASTPATRRSQPITFSGRRVVRTAPTRPRFAGRRRKTRKNGMRRQVAPQQGRNRLDRERDERDDDDRRQDERRDAGATGPGFGSRGVAGGCDHGRKQPEPSFTALLSHAIVPGVLRRIRRPPMKGLAIRDAIP